MGEANEVFAVGKYKGEGANKLSNQDKEHFKEVFLRMEIIGKKNPRGAKYRHFK